MDNIKIRTLEPIYSAVENHNFRELLQHSAKAYPEMDAFIVKNKPQAREAAPTYRHIKYPELLHESEALGTALLELGLQDRTFALLGINSYPWFLSYLTINHGIGKLVPLDKGLPYDELRNSIDRSYSDVLIFDAKHKELIEKLKEDNSRITKFICMDDVEGYINFQSLIENGQKLLEQGKRDFLDMPIDEEKVQLLIFTSGTTSKAKAVMLNQRNIMKNVYGMQLTEDIRKGDVNMAFLPYHHTFGATGQVLMLANGVTTVFCDGLKYVQKNFQEYHVSIFIGVPLIIESLYKKLMVGVRKQGKEKTLARGIRISNFLRKLHIDRRRTMFRDILNPLGGELRMIVSGASALDSTVASQMEAMGITCIQGYGMTEHSPVIASENMPHHVPGSIGLPMPGTEVEINQPDGEGIGELIVRSPSIMLGYFENEEATAAAIKDGWLYTGDLVHLNKQGYICLCGRSKNMIVMKNGKKVFPEEIEELVAALPYVKENIIYAEARREGADDKDLVLVAKIVYNEDYLKEFYNANTQDEIEAVVARDIDLINQKMPNYKSIHRWIIQKEEMAKTTTGKVKRFKEIKGMNA